MSPSQQGEDDNSDDEQPSGYQQDRCGGHWWPNSLSNGQRLIWLQGVVADFNRTSDRMIVHNRATDNAARMHHRGCLELILDKTEIFTRPVA